MKWTLKWTWIEQILLFSTHMVLLPRALPSVRPLARTASTLRLLQSRRSDGDRRPCVYVTGFLTDTGEPGNWRDWVSAHGRLTESLGWCDEAHGLDWRTGSTGDMLGRWPLPLHLAVLAARRSSPAALAAGVAGDALLNAVRLVLHFRAAETCAAKDAHLLVDACRGLSDAHGESGYRVAAHSLGCRLVVDAMPMLPPSHRPAEVHLCAAAVRVSHALPKLDQLVAPQGRLFHYYSSADEALSTGFLLASGGEPALGSAPLPEPAPPGASSHDATPYIGVAAHSAYKAHFDRLAADAALDRPPPPPPRAAWLLAQQAQLRDYIWHELRRLPAAAAHSDMAAFGTTARGLLRSMPALPRPSSSAVDTLSTFSRRAWPKSWRWRRGRG